MSSMTMPVRIAKSMATTPTTAIVGWWWRADLVLDLSSGAGSLVACFPDRGEGCVELFEPVLLVLADEAHAPGEGVGAGSGDAGFDQGVEHDPLWLGEPGHDWHGQLGEVVDGVAAARRPGHLAAGQRLQLVGDRDPLGPGFFPEAADPADLWV